MLSNKFLSTMVILVFVILYVHVAFGNICGLAPVGNCMQQCYKACRGKLAHAKKQGADDLQNEELIATDNFVCYGKCRGNVTTPKNAPGDETELKQCIAMPCGDPVSKSCMKGYLPKFFYCECHKCCAEKTNKDDSACAAGCFDVFGKPDGPDGVDVCRFRMSENLRTPHTWCLSYCAWKLLKLKNLPITEVPNIGSKLTLCMSRCTVFMKNGEYWDFETKLSNEYCIAEPERCSSSLKVTKLVITKGITDAEVTAAAKEDVLDSEADYTERTYFGPSRIPNEVREVDVDTNFTVFRTLVVHWPAAFPDMLNQNFIITCDEKVGTEITYSNAAQKIDWPAVSSMLVSAFNADKSNADVSHRISNLQQILVTQKVKLHSCENYEYYGLMTRAKGLSLAFDIYAEVSEFDDLKPTSAADLQEKLKNKWSSLQYVKDASAENTIEVKGTATAEFSFGIAGKIQGDCKPTSNIYNGQPVCQDPAHDYSAGCVCTLNC